MADSYIQVPPDSTGKRTDTETVTTGVGEVHRQRVQPIPPTASNTYGENAAVTPGATATLVSFNAPDGWGFQGMIAGGEADGKFLVQYDAATKYVSRTNIARRAGDLLLPSPDRTAGGTVVTIKVTNTGDVTAAYEATLLGV